MLIQVKDTAGLSGTAKDKEVEIFNNPTINQQQTPQIATLPSYNLGLVIGKEIANDKEKAKGKEIATDKEDCEELAKVDYLEIPVDTTLEVPLEELARVSLDYKEPARVSLYCLEIPLEELARDHKELAVHDELVIPYGNERLEIFVEDQAPGLQNKPSIMHEESSWLFENDAPVAITIDRASSWRL
ncbi:hypothetical protein ACH5RR_015699 [Cinchona calisaya]|uniref:Uncharacterized protein n=1 Tax=Cinchona calisaya TaxID=153742 RepID=A0ABD2ZX03_9GENT